MRKAAVVLLAAALALVPNAVRANGITAHAHISDLAVNELPPGELRDFLSDPEVRTALRSGSVFPDSGYAADEAYGEIAHWEPFTNAYLEEIVAAHPPPWTSLEDRQRVAFLLGAMSHGMADQVGDSLFMHKTNEHDGSSDNLDEYADMWLLVEHDPGIAPLMPFVPSSELHDVLLRSDGIDTAPGRFDDGMGLVATGLAFEARLASAQYDRDWRALPWSATHYYAGTTEAGSLPHIAYVVSRYWQVVWERLHQTDALERSMIATWPEEGGTNFEVDPALAECRAMIVFGHAIDSASFSSDTVTLRAADGTIAPSRARFQWSDVANAVLVLPDAMLAYDTEYVVELGTGIRTMDGRNLPAPVTLGFRTRCAPDHLADCPPLPAPWVPPVGPPPRPDAGPRDSGPPRSDAGGDAGDDAGAAAGTTSTCGCRVGARRSASGASLALALSLLGLIARRRRNAGASA